MVEIISKRDGPRREDVRIRQILQENRGVITKLADQLSNGRYSQSQRPRPVPQPDGLIIHIGDTPVVKAEPESRIRVTANGRVIAVDTLSGRQLEHFGDIRAKSGGRIFVLAVSANGYIAPLDETLADALADIDGVSLGACYDAGELAADIGRRIDIAVEG